MIRTLRYRTAAWQRWLAGLPRASTPRGEVERVVAAILRAVRRRGDAALVRFTARFDRVRLTPRQLRVPAAEIRALARRADIRVVAALRDMARQIEVYHRRQKDGGFRMRLRDGSRLEEVVRPLASVGLYVPGGAGAYPSSVLMNAIPALVAGVPRVAVVTPPRALESNPAVAAALVIVGLEGSVHRVGGAQAVAALAYGTESVRAVDRIVGPGNAWVAAAKRQVRGQVEIDHDAGPSEVVVLADDTATPRRWPGRSWRGRCSWAATLRWRWGTTAWARTTSCPRAGRPASRRPFRCVTSSAGRARSASPRPACGGWPREWRAWPRPRAS